MKRKALAPPLLLAAVAMAVLFAGCGSSSDSSGREAGQVALAYAKAMSKLDVHKACELEFTNRHGPAYAGKSEADKKRECEEGHLNNHPLQPGAPGPPELDEERFLYGLNPAVVQSASVSGGTATMILHKPHTDERRHIRLIEEDGRWLVYEVEIGELLGG